MKKILLMLMAVALLASCRSSKKMAKENDGVNDKITTIVTPGTDAKKPDAKKPEAKAELVNFTAKVKVTITQGDQTMSTNGMLRMRQNDVIQLTLSDPFFGITEVGRMELSPENLLVIDRINKRYVSAAYDQIAPMRDKGIDFDAIQTRFWDEARKSNSFSFTIPAGSKAMKLDLELSDKGNSDKWEAHTQVSSKYTKTDVDKLLKGMTNK